MSETTSVSFSIGEGEFPKSPVKRNFCPFLENSIMAEPRTCPASRKTAVIHVGNATGS